MPNGLRLGAPFGIALRLHWSFLLLGGWLALSVLGQTGSIAAVFGLLVIVSVVFGSVALHEYGHALVARHYGIGTREITLLPIGGIAQLERSPSNPRHELWISLAGPAVNMVLAGIAGALIGLLGSPEKIGSGLLQLHGSLLEMALRINLIMGIFNLIPALPMDGGRVLRATLAMRMPAVRATRVASTVAQVFAGAMMAYGVVGGRLMLAVIGGFVWISSRAELRRVEMEAMLREQLKQAARAGYGPPSASPASEWYQPNSSDPGPITRIVGTNTDRKK